MAEPVLDMAAGVDTKIRSRIYRTIATINRTDERMRALLMGGTIQIIYYSVRGARIVDAIRTVRTA